MEYIDRQWINRAEALWRRPITQQYVEHGLTMADEQHQDEIRGKADWRLPAAKHRRSDTP